MPKASAMGKTISKPKERGEIGYWMYADGSSNWGIGIMHGREVPLKTTKEIHNANTEEKMAWYAGESRSKERAKEEADSKKK